MRVIQRHKLIFQNSGSPPQVLCINTSENETSIPKNAFKRIEMASKINRMWNISLMLFFYSFVSKRIIVYHYIDVHLHWLALILKLLRIWWTHYGFYFLILTIFDSKQVINLGTNVVNNLNLKCFQHFWSGLKNQSYLIKKNIDLMIYTHTFEMVN